MGEYVKVNGQQVKIGTCESMYYITFQQFNTLYRQGKVAKDEYSDAPGRILKNDSGYRFRFPFPDEDLSNWPDDYPENHDRGLMVPWPADLLTEAEHLTICKSLTPIGQQYGNNINAFIPCPLDWPTKSGQFSRGPHTRYLQIVQQKHTDHRLWTVVRCAYCGQLWRLSPEEARLLVNSLRSYRSNYNRLAPHYQALADIISAGYREDPNAH